MNTKGLDALEGFRANILLEEGDMYSHKLKTWLLFWQKSEDKKAAHSCLVKLWIREKTEQFT